MTTATKSQRQTKSRSPIRIYAVMVDHIQQQTQPEAVFVTLDRAHADRWVAQFNDDQGLLSRSWVHCIRAPHGKGPKFHK